MFKTFFCFVLLVFVQGSFEAEQREWREQRDQELRAEDGWLSVAGLFWLKQGSNSFGTGKSMDIVLPAGSAPENIGTLELGDGVVTLTVTEGVTVTLPPKAIKSFEMRFDGNSQPPSFLVGSLRLSVIKRGERYGLRVKDKNSQALREFKGLEWFPARESYRVVATFTPYAEPKEMMIMNVLGDELKMKSPGLLTFELNGRTHQLRPVVENDEKLFIIFRDRTAGKTTYGAGRYLYADLPKDGKVVLDFNRAENPPCAFTLYATCPLPPRQNFLPIEILAGERAFQLKTKKS
ncbi:MAG TPA: DUF1684 domain-containing protein [Pyrinomonadaceae bacterium]|nr:DUF1684 domain-containing protein [Pyrinomonadaceae bacterium]